MRHPRDPAWLHDRAKDIGELLATGQLSRESVRHVCHEMAKTAPNVDQIGLGVRLVWSAHDHADARARAAWKAEDAVRRTVRPLLHDRASKAAIEEAAGSAAGDDIGWERIFAILRDELRRFRHLSRWRR